MALVFPLNQGLVNGHDHESAVNSILNSPWATKILISSAFVREGGVSKLQDRLNPVAGITKAFFGIANGITSKQALLKCLDIGLFPYVIDMGTQSSIFHTKVYAAIGENQAELIVGSANLTSSGLADNIETSSLLKLDLNEQNDRNYILGIVEPFENLIGSYPKNVFQITTAAEIDQLVLEGRLEDEMVKKSAPVVGTKAPGTPSSATPAFPVIRRNPAVVPAPPIPPQPVAAPAIPAAGPAPAQGLVWSSKPLSERDLCIPTGANTNPTGSMYLKKGRLEGIEQRSYFKNVVFAPLKWSPDTAPNKQHLLRAEAIFEIIINGISQGQYKLKITHNSKTNTPTYRQNNAMTQVHWGDAKPIIAQRGLLQKNMMIYHLGGDKYQMVIT